MSIQTEITRINNAKANILTSISNKGVDTSKVNTIDEVPELINNITTSENLTTELNTQNTLISIQETTINDIISTLETKTVEDLSNELNEQNTLLNTQESTIDNIIETLKNKTINSGSKHKKGIFTLSNGVAEYDLILGFQPKLVIVNILENEVSSGLCTIGWVKSETTLNQVLLINAGTQVYTLKAEDYTEILTDGIKLKRYGSYNLPKGTYSYEAYGE